MLIKSLSPIHTNAIIIIFAALDAIRHNEKWPELLFYLFSSLNRDDNKGQPLIIAITIGQSVAQPKTTNGCKCENRQIATSKPLGERARGARVHCALAEPVQERENSYLYCRRL